MIGIEIVDYTALLAFWLIFGRILAVTFQLPMFDNNSVPSLVKILFSLIISYAFYPYLKTAVIRDINYFGENQFWYLSIGYILFGLVIGFLVKAILSIYVAAGSIITQQVGFGAIRYFDPSSAQQVGPFEKIISFTILLIIVNSGALLPMLKGLYNSFLGQSFYHMFTSKNIAIYYTDLFKSIFISALLLASPMIFMNMLIMSILGIIARTVPQMNIIMVSFVVNIGLGLLVFASSSGEFFQMAFKMYVDKLGSWFQFVI